MQKRNPYSLLRRAALTVLILSSVAQLAYANPKCEEIFATTLFEHYTPLLPIPRQVSSKEFLQDAKRAEVQKNMDRLERTLNQETQNKTNGFFWTSTFQISEKFPQDMEQAHYLGYSIAKHSLEDQNKFEYSPFLVSVKPAVVQEVIDNILKNSEIRKKTPRQLVETLVETSLAILGPPNERMMITAYTYSNWNRAQAEYIALTNTKTGVFIVIGFVQNLQPPPEPPRKRGGVRPGI